MGHVSKLVSARELGRNIGIPSRTAARLTHAGVLLPDFITRREILFRPDRVRELRLAAAVREVSTQTHQL